MKDATLITTKAFPAAAASNNHDGIDLGDTTAGGGIKPENMELEISWPTLANLVEAKDIDFTVEDSADNVTFAPIGITHQVTGESGDGLTAGAKLFRLPSTTRRYVRVAQAVETGGGDNTGNASTVSLVFH